MDSDSSDSDADDFVDHQSGPRLKRSVNSSDGVVGLLRAPPAYAKMVVKPKWSKPGNPDYGPRMQIYCRTGYHLAILPNSKVIGVNVDRHPCALLELTTAGVGQVRIQGLHSNLYLAMSKEGLLYGEKDPTRPHTVFVEYMFGMYNTYLSRHWAHVGWYLAIKKSGKPKRGYHTRWGQKATQFLPRRLS